MEKIDKTKIKLLSAKIILIRGQYKIEVEYEYEEINTIVILSLHHTVIDEIECDINFTRRCRVVK